MHPEAHDAVGRMLDLSGIERAAPWRVLDLGGRDINGTIRAHLPKGRTYKVLGTDGFGRSDTRAALREANEVGADAAAHLEEPLPFE